MAKIDKYNFLLDKVISYDYKDKDTNITNYVGYTLNRSLIMFKYHGLPDTIPQEELEQLLQTGGYAAIAKAGNEVYAFTGGLGGEQDVYKNPTQIVISNPALNFNETLKIGEECVLMKNDTLCMGLLPLYYRYSTMITENDITMILATVNKRVQQLLAAADNDSYESAESFVKKLFDGELSVIADSKLFDGIKNIANNAANAVKMQELIEFEQYLKASLFNEIGLNANYNMKRERLTKGEVEANTDNLYPLVDNMLSCRREALEKVNEMFGLNIEVEFNSSWDYRVFQGQSIHNTDEELESLDGMEQAGEEAGEGGTIPEGEGTLPEGEEMQIEEAEGEAEPGADEQEPGVDEAKETNTDDTEQEGAEPKPEEAEQEQKEESPENEEADPEKKETETEQEETDTEKQEKSPEEKETTPEQKEPEEAEDGKTPDEEKEEEEKKDDK